MAKQRALKPFLSPHCDHYRATRVLHKVLLNAVREATGGGHAFLGSTAPDPIRGAIDDLEQDNCDDEDTHDAEADSRDEETVMWGDDLASQEVLVHLG